MRRGGAASAIGWPAVICAACAIATGCHSAPAKSGAPAAGTVRNVKWLTDADGATGFYTTTVSLTDCPGQAADMIDLWKVAVRPMLDASPYATVTLFPEEPSGRSASFTFTRDAASKRWRAPAPCDVTIPE